MQKNKNENESLKSRIGDLEESLQKEKQNRLVLLKENVALKRMLEMCNVSKESMKVLSENENLKEEVSYLKKQLEKFVSEDWRGELDSLRKDVKKASSVCDSYDILVAENEKLKNMVEEIQENSLDDNTQALKEEIASLKERLSQIVRDQKAGEEEAFEKAESLEIQNTMLREDIRKVIEIRELGISLTIDEVMEALRSRIEKYGETPSSGDSAVQLRNIIDQIEDEDENDSFNIGDKPTKVKKLFELAQRQNAPNPQDTIDNLRGQIIDLNKKIEIMDRKGAPSDDNTLAIENTMLRKEILALKNQLSQVDDIEKPLFDKPNYEPLQSDQSQDILLDDPEEEFEFSSGIFFGEEEEVEFE